MTTLLFKLIKFTVGTVAQIIYSVISTCLRNRNSHNGADNKLVSRDETTPRKVTSIDEYRRRSKLKAERSMTSTLATERFEEEQDQRDYVDVQRLLDAPMKEIFILDDLPVLIEIPNAVAVIRDVCEILDSPEPTRTIPIIRTPRRKPIADPGFSIYADPSAQSHLNKAMYITPVRQAFTATGNIDIDLSLLTAASERVSEILKENRRRVDAGEDTSTVRREARRRRAQEISAARQNLAGGFSYL